MTGIKARGILSTVVIQCVGKIETRVSDKIFNIHGIHKFNRNSPLETTIRY